MRWLAWLLILAGIASLVVAFSAAGVLPGITPRRGSVCQRCPIYAHLPGLPNGVERPMAGSARPGSSAPPNFAGRPCTQPSSACC